MLKTKAHHTHTYWQS